MKVAVIGHSALDVAPAVAADLALRGFDVAWWPAPAAVRQAGGITVEGGGAELDAGRDGFARLRLPETAGAALEQAAAVITDIPPERLLQEVSALTLPSGTLLHVQSHGYWPALRLQQALDRADILFTDAAAPTHAAGLKDGVLTPHQRRRGLRFSALQGDPMALLRQLYPGAEAAGCALETGLEGINLMVHPALSLLNVAAIDRAKVAGEGFGFYAEGNTESTSVLAAALDAERGRVCLALGVRHQSLPAALKTLYGTTGDTPGEAVAQCGFYARLGALSADSWRRWVRQDLPFAIIPLLRLAGLAGVAAPLHQGVASIFAALLGEGAADAAPSLNDLGIQAHPLPNGAAP